MKMYRCLGLCVILILMICSIALPAFGEDVSGKAMEMYLSNNRDGSWEIADDPPDDVVRISSYSFPADEDGFQTGEVVYCFQFLGVSPGKECMILKWMRNGKIYMYIDMQVMVDENLQASVAHFELVPGNYWEDGEWTEIDPEDSDWEWDDEEEDWP